MSRLITLECDAHEVRIAIGSSGLTGVTIESILSGPIEIPDGEEPWGTDAVIKALKSLLSEAGVRSGEAIACVSRNDIELRAITLPDVDANELPDMVRFAAPRYFANVADNWPLDFITMPSHLEGSIDCVVGAINPTLVQKIEKTVAEAGLTLSHVVLRPMAAVAGAIARHTDWLHSSVLFMDILNEEVDVVIAENGNAVFMRAFHAPGDASDSTSSKHFAAEVKRTLLSAVSQRPGLKVDRIVLWSKESMAPVAEALSSATELPVTMLDPFSWAEKAKVAIAATTQTVGRFAPILGAFHSMQQRDRLIDFTNPRKRIEKSKPIALYALAASAVLAIFGGGGWWYWSSHAQLDSEIALLRQTINDSNNTLKTANKHSADWKKVETFLKGDVPWLDELETLSVRAMGTDQVFFNTTTFMLEPRSNVASISAKYYAKEQDIVPEVQAAYRDPKHTVKGTAVTQGPNKEFPVASDLTITLAPIAVPDPRNVQKVQAPAKPSQPDAVQGAETEKTSETEKAGENASPESPQETKPSDSDGAAPTPVPPTNGESAPATPPSVSPPTASEKKPDSNAPPASPAPNLPASPSPAEGTSPNPPGDAVILGAAS